MSCYQEKNMEYYALIYFFFIVKEGGDVIYFLKTQRKIYINIYIYIDVEFSKRF